MATLYINVYEDFITLTELHNDKMRETNKITYYTVI